MKPLPLVIDEARRSRLHLHLTAHGDGDFGWILCGSVKRWRSCGLRVQADHQCFFRWLRFSIITMIGYFAIYHFDRKEVNYAAHAFERDIGTVKTDSFM